MRLQEFGKFLREKKWKNLKKSDWAVIGLVGLLLLVIAIPLDGSGGNSSADDVWMGEQMPSGEKGTPGGDGAQTDPGAPEQNPEDYASCLEERLEEVLSQMDGVGRVEVMKGTPGGDGAQTDPGAPEQNPEDYASCLEERLEEVLSQMDGVGRVEVMVTVADSGERVLEKDVNSTVTDTTETDSTGGSRNISERVQEEVTIYTEKGSESYPYVQKEKLPAVEGVVIVAEGGDNMTVVSDISGVVKALLPVEAHRIKVVKMCSKEE